MELLQAKATTTQTTDLGEFSALVSVFGIEDRGGDVVHRGAFARSIADWKATARRVPLHYNHDPDEIIGDIDEMKESREGLEVSGRVDLDDELGRKVWKSLKRNRIGFSFGFMTVKSREREGGGKDLLELDIFEISATPSPMNNQVRLLSAKGLAEPEVSDWRDDDRYSYRGRPISYRRILLKAEVDAATERIEAEEREAERKAVEAQREAEAQRPVIPTTSKPFYDDSGARAQMCAAEGCGAYPRRASGALQPVHDRRWWCPDHRHLAGPEDHLPEPPTYIPTGGPSPFAVKLNPRSEEGKRVAAEEERRREMEQGEREHAEREAEVLRQVKDRYDREAKIVVNGIRISPSQLRIR